MTKAFRSKFIELKVVGERSVLSESEKRNKDLRLIDFLKSVIVNNEFNDFEDIGFCFWNISDNYAFLRDGHNLFKNHTAFYDLLKSQKEKYLYWLCCDATQRFTLEKDGYSEFWWDIYKKSVSKNKGLNSVAEYHAHRAALSISPVLGTSKENLEFTLNSISNFLAKQQNTADFEFYNAIFHIMQSGITKQTGSISKLSMPFLSKLNGNDNNSFLCGEWESFTSPISQSKQAKLVLNTAINTLIYAENQEEAKKLYSLALQNGMLTNSYIEKRLK